MIALFTDFGCGSPYTGQVKAVLASELAHEKTAVAIVDIFSDLPAYNIKAASYLLPAYSNALARDAICMCVVDPGVGSDRKGLIVRADDRWYTGPDNGLFTQIVCRAKHVECREINWRPKHLSASFHGRDLFAPVAAMLARGDDVPGTALPDNELICPDWPDDLNEIVYIDHYGNAITGLRARQISEGSFLEAGGRRLCFARTFSALPPGTPFWYENANGLVEFSVNQGRAAELLGLEIGDPFRVIQEEA